MNTLINREFIVNATADAAFGHLAQVEKWPSWAKHIPNLIAENDSLARSKGDA